MGTQKASKANAPDLTDNQNQRDVFVELTPHMIAVALFAVEDTAAVIGREAGPCEQEHTGHQQRESCPGFGPQHGVRARAVPIEAATA